MFNVRVKVVRLEMVSDEVLGVAVIIACMHMVGRIAFEFVHKPLHNGKPGADPCTVGAKPQSLWPARPLRR